MFDIIKSRKEENKNLITKTLNTFKNSEIIPTEEDIKKYNNVLLEILE